MLKQFMWERFMQSGAIDDYLVFAETRESPSHDV